MSTVQPNVFITCNGATTLNELRGQAIQPTVVHVSCVAKAFAYFCDRRIVGGKGKTRANKKITIFKCQGCSWEVKFIKRSGAVAKDDPWYLDVWGLPTDGSLDHEPECIPIDVLTRGDILRNCLSLREYLMENSNANKSEITEFLRTTENIDVSQMATSSFHAARKNILQLLELEQPTEPEVRPDRHEGVGELEEEANLEDLSVSFSLGSIAVDYLGEAAAAMSTSSAGTERMNSSANFGVEPSDPSHNTKNSIEEHQSFVFSDVLSTRDEINSEKRARSVNSVSSSSQPAKQKPRASSSIFSREKGRRFKDSLLRSRRAASGKLPEDRSFMEKVCNVVGPESVAEQSTISAMSVPRSAAHETITSVSMHEPTTVSSLSVPKSNPSSEGSLAMYRDRSRSRAVADEGLPSDSVSLGSKSKASSASRAKARFRSTLEKVQEVVKSRSRAVENPLGTVLDRALNEDGWIQEPTALTDVVCALVVVMESNRIQEGALYQNAVCLLTLLYINRSESSPFPESVIRQVVEAMQVHARSDTVQHIGCGVLHTLATCHAENRMAIAAANGIEVVIQAMRLYIQNEKILKEGCRMLRIFVGDSITDTEAAVAAASAAKAAVSGYEVVAKAVGLFLENEAIQKECFRTLRTLSTNHGGTISEGTVLSSIPAIMKSLQAFSGNPSIQKDGCRLLRELVAGSKKTAEIAGKIGSVLLVRIMRVHEEISGIQRDSFYLLKTITHQETRHKAPPGCVDVVVLAMHRHEHIVDIQKDGCCILSQLSSADSRALDEIILSNGIEAIMTAMSLHKADAAIQKDGCCILSQLSSADSRALDEIIMSTGIEAIVNAMSLHKTDAAIQKNGCCILSQISSADSHTPAEIAASNCIEVIVNAMSLHKADAAIQKDGCCILYQIFSADSRALAIIETSIGIEVIVNAMRLHKADAAIQKGGCCMLDQLSSGDSHTLAEMATSNGIEAIVNAMSLHKADVDIQLKGWAMLAQLSLNGESSTCVDVITGVMHMHESNEDVQTQWCLALRRLVLREAKLRTTSSIASKLANAIVQAMYRFYNSKLIQRDGCRVLRVLIEHESNQLKAAETRIVEVVVKAMASHGEDVDIQSDCCFLLCQLLDNWSWKLCCAASNCVPWIIRNIEQHKNHGDMQADAFRALRWFAESVPETRSKIIDCHGIKRVCDSMKHNISNTEIQRDGCSILDMLEIDDLLKYGDVEDVVMQALRHHAEDQSVQSGGFRLFQSITENSRSHTYLSNENPHNAISIGLGVILKGMCAHADDPIIQMEGCRVLWNLAKRSVDYGRVKIVRLGGIEVIGRAMSLHQRDEGLQEMGCRMLCFLTSSWYSGNESAIRDANGIGAIAFAMACYTEHIGIQGQGCRALGMLASEHRGKTAIMRANGMHLILQAMCRFGDDVDLQVAGCSALHSLIRNDSQNKDALVASNGIAVIVQAVLRHRSALESIGNDILKSVCCLHEHNRSTALSARTGLELIRSTRPTDGGQP